MSLGAGRPIARGPGSAPGALEFTTLSSVSDAERMRFCQRMFPRRADFLGRHWRWVYRVGFQAEIEPPVVVSNGILVGLGGAIPIALSHRDERHIAIFYVDLALLPEFQGTGLGKRLTSVFMDICPTKLGFNANRNSIVVLERLGWQPGPYARRCALPIDIARLGRKRGGAVTRAALRMLAPPYRQLLRTWFGRAPDLVPEKLPADPAALTALLSVESPGPVQIVRDLEWARWRVFESPFFDSHRLFRLGDACALVRGVVWQGQRRLHVLLTDRFAAPAERQRLLRGIVKWAIRHRVDLVWTVVNGKAILEEIRSVLPFHAPIRFVATTDDQALLTGIRGPGFEMQGIDCDSDIMYPADPGPAFSW